MFTFFDSLKKEFSVPKVGNFQVVLIGQQFLYIEGHKGIFKMSHDNMTFKVKNGLLVVMGENLVLKELTKSTVAVSGTIKHFEVV